MKKIHSLFCVASCLALVATSCSEDSSLSSKKSFSFHEDGDSISNYYANPCEDYSNRLVPFAVDITKDYGNVVAGKGDSLNQAPFSVSSVANLRLVVYTSRYPYEFLQASRATEEDEIEYQAIQERWRTFYQDRFSDDFAYIERPRITQEFIYAGLKDALCVSADKELFGLAPGANLLGHLMLTLQPEQQVSANYPDCSIRKDYRKESDTVRADEYFTKNMLLSSSPYWLSFMDEPVEQYDELTFTFTMPIVTEYFGPILFGKDYPEEWYEQGLLERSDNRVLEGSVMVKFK